MKRLNITLPDETAKKLEQIKNKSRFIAEALNEKIEKENKKQLEKLLIEGYSASYKEDLEIQDSWQITDTEHWQ
jgi:metal-responsive CopG/Arc/MetJ family transcriptional regulator